MFNNKISESIMSNFIKVYCHDTDSEFYLNMNEVLSFEVIRNDSECLECEFSIKKGNNVYDSFLQVL